MPRRLVALALLVTVLAGCAAQPVPPQAATVERHVVASFELEGRVLATDGEQSASGRIQWLHAPDTDEWTMYSPLGQIVARLDSAPGGARLHTAEGRQYSAPDAQSMLPELLGVPVPADGLAYWVQAIPRPHARVLRRDAVGRPARISDAGWIIDYLEYATPDPGAPPRRIEAHWGTARIRLVIDAWAPAP